MTNSFHLLLDLKITQKIYCYEFCFLLFFQSLIVRDRRTECSDWICYVSSIIRFKRRIEYNQDNERGKENHFAFPHSRLLCSILPTRFCGG